MGLLGRMNQKLKEKAGRSAKTIYGQEFQDRLKMVEFLYRQTEILTYRFDSLAKSVADCDSVNRVEVVATNIGELAKHIPPEPTDYLQTLTTLVPVLLLNAHSQRNFCKILIIEVVHYYQNWMKSDALDIHKNIKELEKRRVEMDAAAHKAQGYEGVSSNCNVNDKKEAKIVANAQAARQLEEETRQAHDQQFMIVENLIGSIVDDFEKHCNTIVLYMKARYSFFASNAIAFENL